MYSNVNNKGHFGIMKVIIGETGIDNAINDYEGKYGMTQDSFAFKISSKNEGDEILKIIKTPEFKKLLKESCSWSNFRIDWRLFTYFKKDFYKYFIDNNIINSNSNITVSTKKILKQKNKIIKAE
jgi:hypothetical protein